MAVYEGRWDCHRCGRRGNRGGAHACTGCGARRPIDVEFYLPENEPAIADQGALRAALAGPDWGCRYCATANSALNQYCANCGASRSGDSPVAPADSDSDETPPPARTAQPRRGTNPVIWAVGPLLALIVALLGYGAVVPGAQAGALLKLRAMFLPERVLSATVTLRDWERSVAIERRSVVHGEGWSVPPGARVTGQQTRARGTRQVIDHYNTGTRTKTERVKTGTESYSCGRQNLGNGRFKDKTCTRDVYSSRTRSETYREPVYRSEPVIDTWYTYQQDRWSVTRTAKASGKDNPAWPAFTLAAGEREGQRVERYRVSFVGDDKRTYVWQCDRSTWTGLQLGRTYRLRVSGADEPLRLEPAR